MAKSGQNVCGKVNGGKEEIVFTATDWQCTCSGCRQSLNYFKICGIVEARKNQHFDYQKSSWHWLFVIVQVQCLIFTFKLKVAQSPPWMRRHLNLYLYIVYAVMETKVSIKALYRKTCFNDPVSFTALIFLARGTCEAVPYVFLSKTIYLPLRIVTIILLQFYLFRWWFNLIFRCCVCGA